MKRLGVLGMFLLVSYILYANYHPMLAIKKQWSYLSVHISYVENPPVEDKHSFSISIIDTTLINGQKYYVIDNLLTSGAGQVYMREDTAAQQVWILKDEDDKEHLLFKFNVAVGDTLRNVTFYSKENPMLDLSHAEYVVTSISFIEGRKNIILHAFVPYNKDFNPEAAPYEQYFTWVEGVGEQQWGLSATHFEDGNVGGMYVNITSLLCVQQGDELLYASGKGKEYGCGIETSVYNVYTEGITCTNINGQYVVYIPGNEKVLSMLLFDSLGRQVLPIGYTRDVLPTALPSSVYILIIKTNKRCYKTRIVIQ